MIIFLGKTIIFYDKKFLKLVNTRLEYSFVEKATNERFKPVGSFAKDGIPQGGIDSPLLWNIYMHEFDKFIHTDIFPQDLVDKYNKSI
jgi:hypothetical protein